MATEVSEEALAWARRTRDRSGANVELIRGDLLEGLDTDLHGRIDVVVSNPPYVPPEEERLLPVNVREHEPAVALFAPEHGLAVIERLVRSAGDWLRGGGWLVLEIGETQDDAVAIKLRDAGYLDVETRRDLTGRMRIAEGRVA
jgi:release factor glutamine methyltransferase